MNRSKRPLPLSCINKEEYPLLALGSSTVNRPLNGSLIHDDTPTYWPISAWLSKSPYPLESPIQSPPLSPPPLSPAESKRPLRRKPRYQPAYSISSSDDDDEPLSELSAALKSKVSLLSDDEEEGDDELIPIACLNSAPVLSAAEKYKAKVKARLQLDAYL
ncbi:hypothetical protein G6F46_004645 [Rhizopus delemar]|nr:hypothetical protein G6F43_007530 [Rhizopus delemar]KAG1541660.1 hypothetical protein G6F51_007750 [Rhizopus arrhizus]KAG1456673.1 hypothetical protein G6F55_006372 [Rhizopus delemar]KAG1495867.1 hypothetical protein G6F54_006880 [Rhizopus delemar]KAG1509632.1 hypothetical protein G6F53_007292 [Rhizopus delemar]